VNSTTGPWPYSARRLDLIDKRLKHCRIDHSQMRQSLRIMPVTPESYARLATIPHGDSVLAQSTFAKRLNTGPTIDPVDSTPFTGETPDLNSAPANRVTNDEYLKQYSEGKLPEECLPANLNDAEPLRTRLAFFKRDRRTKTRYR